MRLTRTFMFLLPFLFACGGSVQVILKPPVEKQCSKAGLEGCPEFTQGVLMYIEGDEANGKVALEKGAAANAPAKVRKFAKMIKKLKKIPGASSYTVKIVEVADIILAASKNSKGAAGPADPDEDDDIGK
jgi:hypothetical protein